MIDSQKLTKDNLIEEEFCKKFELLERYQMNDELSKLMITLILTNIKQAPKELEEEFLYKVILKRMEYCFTFVIEDYRLIVFLMYLTQNPGKAVMYLTYLQYWCKKSNTKEIDFNIFCERIFSFGFPSNRDLDKLWEDCKVNTKPDNLLDYQSAMKSIQFEL